jgi:hypothetical protein
MVPTQPSRQSTQSGSISLERVSLPIKYRRTLSSELLGLELASAFHAEVFLVFQERARPFECKALALERRARAIHSAISFDMQVVSRPSAGTKRKLPA